MSKDFNYKDFVDQLRFQVRGVIPEKYQEHEVYIRDMVYQMSLIAAKALFDEDDIKENNCQYITQIIAEWTFHKTIDLISIGVPQKYHEAVLNKINHDIYNLLANILANTSEDLYCAEKSNPKILTNVEKLLNKSFKKAIYKLYNANLISKKSYNAALKQSNIDEMSVEFADEESIYTVPVSIWDVLKVHPFISLAYIFALPVTLISSLLSIFVGRIPLGIAILSLFLLLLRRFLTREADIRINLPESDE